MTMQLRVLLVADAVGGVWVYSLELARGLKAIGIETVLAVMGPSPSATQREEARGIKLIDTGLPLDWLETNAAELRRAGNALAEIAVREDADIVQTCSAALLADTEFEQPCVAVQHSCVASWWRAVKGTALPDQFAWLRELVERGLNRAATVVAPSIAFAAETARIYDLSTPVLFVHNGRSPAGTTQVAQADFVFTVSRLWDEGKNVATLDAAAARLGVPFQAAGPVYGPNGATIYLENVRALGEVGHAPLKGLLAAQPIFASAALYEPFGLSVLEAAQAGCALVLSDIPTHREIWGGAAIFVAARDDGAFAGAIQDLLDDPDERRELGQLARARAQLYTPERMARGMADIYDGVARPRVETGPREMAGAA
jgi:glycosyltransferase involved in cell wall biosynthesis